MGYLVIYSVNIEDSSRKQKKLSIGIFPFLAIENIFQFSMVI